MSEFINTADVIGDEEMCDQIIMRTVTEYKENRISKVGQYAFYECTALNVVDVPNVSTIAANSMYKCSALIALILRNMETVCSLDATSALTSSAIASGTGYIYVPSALLADYQAATNWSTYADQIRALEDYTVDGTTTGKFAAGFITYNLDGFTSSNKNTFVLHSAYQTTLTAFGDNASVTIIMDGVDVTAEVYNAETGEVNIPKAVGNVVITASCDCTNPFVFYEVGGIGYQTGANEDNTIRFRTGNIPFDPSINTFQADVVVNGNTSAKARLLVRPYKANGTFISTNFANIISPAVTNNWALSGTKYTFNPGSECAYVRVVFSDATDTTASTLTGTITVSDVTYNLAKE